MHITKILQISKGISVLVGIRDYIRNISIKVKQSVIAMFLLKLYLIITYSHDEKPNTKRIFLDSWSFYEAFMLKNIFFIIDYL